MRWILIIFAIYVCVCLLLYFIQEQLIFFPQKTRADHRYVFDQPFEEVYVKTADNGRIHGLLFRTGKPKGIIFYLHGNAGSLESWGDVAGVYTALGYDLFMLDYRGYGKSEGTIRSEQQLHTDAKLAFHTITSRYDNGKVIVLGYSLGTAIAAKLAAENQVDLLILQSPYFSMTAVMMDLYKVIPPVVLRYKLETWKYVKACNSRIVIFHGDQDEIINYRSSIRLKQYLKPSDTLITIGGLGHNGMSEHPQYLASLQGIL